MRRLLFLIPVATLFVATPALAITADAARFDFSLGVPAITADNTNTCNNQATARFDFSLGTPSVVYDATATCTAAAPASGDAIDDGIVWFE